MSPARTLSSPRHTEDFVKPSTIAPITLSSEVTVDANTSTFPIKPEALVNRAKELLKPEINIGINDGGECLAEDFEFCAAVVGPIGKAEYMKALNRFKLQEAFDIKQNYFGFTVSPIEPHRVYFFSQQRATQKGDFVGYKMKPDQKELILPPQVHHMDFNADGKLKEFGFYTVDRRSGNTGGLGGAFAYFYGTGHPLPIPECQPYAPSWRFRFFQALDRLTGKLVGTTQPASPEPLAEEKPE